MQNSKPNWKRVFFFFSINEKRFAIINDQVVQLKKKKKNGNQPEQKYFHIVNKRKVIRINR